MRLGSFFVLILATGSAVAQIVNEVNLYSFQTVLNTKMALSLDTIDNTMYYRYDHKGANELEVMDNLNDSTAVFTYSNYLRGGGIENAGLDLNYIRFEHNGHRYEIFDEYAAEGDTQAIGIRMINEETGAEEEIAGITASVSGSILVFRFGGIIPVMDE